MSSFARPYSLEERRVGWTGMTANLPDKLHYLRIPDGHGARAEMTRLTYVLAGKAYVDVLYTFAEAPAALSGKNPFNQVPFVETPSGEIISQTLAIMHHAGHGTSAWPSDSASLTRALSVAMGAYDLYQAFASLSAEDLAGKTKFEAKKAPQFFGALGAIYAKSPFAAGKTPSFADCIAREAVAWCVRRNPVAAALFEGSSALVHFQKRFDELPEIAAFQARQVARRQIDDSL